MPKVNSTCNTKQKNFNIINYFNTYKNKPTDQYQFGIESIASYFQKIKSQEQNCWLKKSTSTCTPDGCLMTSINPVLQTDTIHWGSALNEKCIICLAH